MKLREKETIAGRSLELEVYPVTEKGYRRDRKNRVSSESQKKLNFKNAIKKLSRPINANFSDGDLIMTLQYNKENRPKIEKEILRDVQNFIRRLKRHVKTNGLSQLKYIYSIEVANDNNWHAHILISKIDINIVNKSWRYSDRVWVKKFNPEKHGGAEALARYFLGQKGDKDYEKGNWRSWNSSKNLIKPTEKIKDTGFSRAQIARIARERQDDRDYWEKRYKGYRLLSVKAFYNEWNGWWYLYIKLYKSEKIYKKPPE